MPESRSPQPDDQTVRETSELRERADRAERERDRLQRENERLRQQIDHLKRQLDDARRAGFRQAAPFAKPLRPNPERPGRRAGPAYGPKGHRPVPGPVDERYDAPLPVICPDCGGPLVETAVASQYQEELPVVRPIVRQFHVHIGHGQRCGHRVQGRHSLQTSNALGAAAAQIGPRATATAAVLHTQYGVPLGKVARVYQQHFGLTITAGGLVHALHRAARQATPTYGALVETIQQSPVVVPDETGWKVGGRLQWLWAFATPTTTVYAIQAGRGFEEAAAILGADFDGALVRDGWAPYRQFTGATWQSCVAHLLRRCRTLQVDHPRSSFAPRVAAILTQALAVRDRRDTGTMSTHGIAVARGHLFNRLNTLVETHSPVPDVQRFARHLARELPGVFTFLLDDRIDATNWRAEQAIRPAVVQRKVSGGNRTWRGAHTQHVLATVCRTSTQRHLNPLPVLVDLLHQIKARVSAALFTPT